MKSKKERDKYLRELRKSIEEKKLGKDKIHIDKDLLEDLLFETKYIQVKDKTVKAKYLIWSGPFLSNIDLSEVSFEDVVWSLAYWPEYYYVSDDYDYTEEDRLIRKDEDNPYTLYNIKKLDLSNTNAKIDFNKSFFGKSKFGYIVIENCDFKNVDLSNNTFDRGRGVYIDYCNLSNTNIDINFNLGEDIIRHSDLSNNDFSTKEIYDAVYDYEYIEYTFFNNSKINLIVPDGEDIDDELKERIKGCYINGVLSDTVFAKQKEEQEEQEHIKTETDILSRLEDIELEKSELELKKKKLEIEKKELIYKLTELRKNKIKEL